SSRVCAQSHGTSRGAYTGLDGLGRRRFGLRGQSFSVALENPRARGGEMSGANASAAARSHQGMTGANASATDRIVFTDVSKFYGEVLGVNKINLTITPGITSLVGPNGSGKTTLMNLMTGLITPTRGDIVVAGTRTDDPEAFYCKV